MRRPSVPSRPLVATLLVVLATAVATPFVATALADTDGDLGDVAGNRTVSQLGLPSSTVGPEARLSASGDLSSVLASDGEQLSTALNVRRFERAFRAAPETQARLAVVRTTADRLTARADRLQSQRTAAVRAFERGEIDARQLFRELVRIRAGARGVERQLDRIRAVVANQSDTALPSDLSVRLTGIEASFVSLDGPVTERIATGVAGGSPQPVYVETATEGISLATISGGAYVRETTVWSARGSTGPDQFAAAEATAPAAAYARTEELYPWASANQVTNPSLQGIGNTAIYVVGLNHRHGELTAYLDGRTTDAFYEIQRLQLSRLPTTQLGTNSTGSLSLTVTGTFDGGPMVVTVTDRAGEPVGATVSLDNTTVGRTDDAGRLWVIDTAGRTTVTAEAGGNSVAVTIDDLT